MSYDKPVARGRNPSLRSSLAGRALPPPRTRGTEPTTAALVARLKQMSPMLIFEWEQESARQGVSGPEALPLLAERAALRLGGTYASGIAGDPPRFCHHCRTPAHHAFFTPGEWIVNADDGGVYHRRCAPGVSDPAAGFLRWRDDAAEWLADCVRRLDRG